MASISSTTSTSYNRITGLATGMDTDAMVKQAMQGYQTKVDQAKQARDLQIFKQTLYRDTITDLRSLFTKYTDIAKTDSMLLTKNYTTSKFTSSNESTVTAEGLSNAVLGNYKVEVQKVATTAKLELDDLSQLKGKKVSLNISGKYVDVELANTLTDDEAIKVLNAAMKSEGVGGKFSKSDIANKIIFQSTQTGTNQYVSIHEVTSETSAKADVSQTSLDGKKLTFNINGSDVKIDLSGVDPLDTKNVLNAQLNQYGVNVTEDAGNISFETTKKGTSSSIKITEDDTSTILGDVKGTTTRASITAEARGTNAAVKITDTYGHTTEGVNGDGFNIYQTNEITIDGVKFKINDVTTSAVTISGTTDTSKLVDKIKEFVKDYNDVVGKITTKLNEKKDLNYKPLTAAQKAEMTEDQIEKWETKVKQGLLKRDNDLTSITSQLRSAFYDSIKGTSLNIKSLGIDFSNDIEKAGQIVIDEEKLSTALSENSEEVVKLFAQTAPTGTTDKKEIYNNSGIFQRIKTILNDNVMSSASTLLQKVGYEGTSTYASNDITNDLLKRERQISVMESNLAIREQKLYQKFATLEKVMNNYNAQSSWLSQQFSG
jgi:flagellar hook-associated protein 2